MKKYLLIIIGAFFLSCCSSQKMSQSSETQNSQLDYQQNDSTGISLLDSVAVKKIDFSAFTFNDFSFHRIIEEEIDAGEAVFVKRRIVEAGTDKSKMMNEANVQTTIQESASLAVNSSNIRASADAESVSSHAVFKQRKGLQWYIVSLAAIALGVLALWKRGRIANVFFKR
ncbi:hypothetical protein [Pseudobacter ginsenosidimutans]|uniref:Uncharacterized protein n=1 Tax=Pseudobacter ginsenosidimutans TaxID=661488 RepID=A0A4Q7MQT2_9BACT|nr:hypothetical protein [Pseudobacter ginsenosidimutans]QEC40298.1 hypothetical protein FSB84_00805 [Pseudobacter ginsenosidimutans]RZS69099.1 hypothetical protein EV199_4924 [Pseudobacter ginsenosidimutans]